MFISVLREPDMVCGATDNSPFRFEEEHRNDVSYTYKDGVVIVHPSGSPVRYLKFRWNGDLEEIDKVYGDAWERCDGRASLDWRCVIPHRMLPWYCHIKSGERLASYGVKTGPNCFAFWQVDTHGITLFMDLTSGDAGVDLKESLVACEVVEAFEEGDSYAAAKHFAAAMSHKTVLPKEPIFGVNNWYWAYGNISEESVLGETDYLMQMCDGTTHRPYMIIDDGWQLARSDNYIGGPWIPNGKFSDMEKLCSKINAKGAKAGIWFRPLLTQDGVLDASNPQILEQVEADASRIRGWGFDLIKHDFTTMDIIGDPTFNPGGYMPMKKPSFDRTRTTAMIIKDLYKAVQKGAGDADVIGCNTISHLTAGIHSVYRVGNDTSGRNFEWTRRNGVNSVMRLPLNNMFYNVDPDCAAFTEKVDPQLNLDFLEMCAITGMTTLASVTPGILSAEEMKRINEIYKIADQNELRFCIKNYDKNANPDIFTDGTTERKFRWDKAYGGARTVLTWKE